MRMYKNYMTTSECTSGEVIQLLWLVNHIHRVLFHFN